MSAHQAAWLMLAEALLLANLAVIFSRSPRNNLLCWGGGYALWMASCRILTTADGQAAPLPWELWAVSVAFFAVLAFPAIVWRYFYRA